MKQNRVSVELLDGTVIEQLRVLFADKIRLERAARANGWDLARDEIRVQGFLAWSAAERTGATSEAYEPFLEQIADVDFEAGVTDEDPTTADPSA